MLGLAIDSIALWETLPEHDYLQNSALSADAEILQNPSFAAKYRKCGAESLTIRHAVAPRLNRLILESEMKIQNDYLDSLSRRIRRFYEAGASKIQLDFDLPSVLSDNYLTSSLLNILRSIKGISYEYSIETELLFRLPLTVMEDFTALAAIFRQQSLLGMNYAIDMHIHEAGFDREEICDSLFALQFDISCINFIYDAALGNKVNTHMLKKIIEHMTNSGAECSCFLLPSGNINFAAVQNDLEQWFADE